MCADSRSGARLLLLSAPGAGKGTQGKRLAERLGIAHLSAGEILREQVRDGTELGRRFAERLDRGELVPDELVVELMLPAIEAAAEHGGYVLDGFPRDLAQAQALEERGVELDRVIHLRAPVEELRRRLLDRAAKEGRSDDTPDVIDHRFRLYDKETRPLVDFYRDRGSLVDVDADRDPGAVAEDVVRALGDAARR
jgi:adenylate kinase